MTIYIAGPMTGYPDYNRPAFDAKAAELRAKGHRVLNPADIKPMPEYSNYWPINKAMLDGSDAIYLLNGWEASPGTRKEFNYAGQHNINIMFEGKSHE